MYRGLCSQVKKIVLRLYELNIFYRIGRTGRKGNSGTAYTFFTQKNMKSAGELIQILTEANQVRFYSLS